MNKLIIGFRIIFLTLLAVAVPSATAEVIPLEPFSSIYEGDGLRIGSLSMSVTYVQAYSKTENRRATGFFYEHEGEYFLITNRHVVLDEKEEEVFKADSITLKLHTSKKNIPEVGYLSVDLYYGSSTPIWLEHPEYRNEADLVAIPLGKESSLDGFVISAFDEKNFVRKEDIIFVGEEVIILGYPLGFYDEYHYFPIIRKGILASFYPVYFDEKPYFYIDARLHSGMSGSPVIFRPGELRSTIRGPGKSGPDTGTVGRIYLLGINSRREDKRRKPTKYRVVIEDYGPPVLVVNVDPIDEKDEPLGLNVVFYSELIEEIIEGQK